MNKLAKIFLAALVLSLMGNALLVGVYQDQVKKTARCESRAKEHYEMLDACRYKFMAGMDHVYVQGKEVYADCLSNVAGFVDQAEQDKHDMVAIRLLQQYEEIRKGQ